MPKPEEPGAQGHDRPEKVQDVAKHGGWRNLAGPVPGGLFEGDPYDYVSFSAQGEAVSWAVHGYGLVDMENVPEGSVVTPLPDGFEFPEDEADDEADDELDV